MPSSTVEDYLKQIYLEQLNAPDALIPMGKLASSMNVVPGTATSMVKTLADSELVIYEPRGGVKLTKGGEKLALHVLRRHRLVELLLVKVLGLDWSEVHEEAEELEHAISEKVLSRIDQVLGHPRVDPHGDPIPPSQGEYTEKHLSSLANCPEGQPMRVCRIIDQDRVFLQLAERFGLTPGVSVTVKHRDIPADAVSLQPATTPAVTLGTVAAAKILVEPE